MGKKIISRQALGQQGESIAADYLLKKGYKLLERNVRTAYGEIDLIAQSDTEVVFVEVKTRTNMQFGYPEESVNRKKRAHLLASIKAFMQSHPELECDWRVDVISIVLGDAVEGPTITHFENAISE